ncbi:hypothetical protein TPHA_0D00240 [Tetrapisispora phaffii CBS 4417]|uniref:Signal peptidase subunit 3 n=1 Tax=Tetrapisispora phaffii (strain ATCC 24235 / CBS 4417 / NBRC 1672 / NRRL Y-8282 / UCD 70-5) TaxID=1071381 RepID=G8BS47_TETPH|nr:hypothetical protein TPHA_0D00240 [Tetrapisispora phaffii CBS 4417]CCE62668.1 hypothetical protein TPHA_0D00240 [Tetrapisispora phaffii CBS 4417]
MYSLSQRFQNVTNQALTYSFLIIGFVIATSWFHLQQNNVFQTPVAINTLNSNINVRSSRFFGSTTGKPKENAKITFDLDADFTPFFNWNTKQIFAYLVAEYNGDEKNTKNTVTFWDKIIADKENAVLSIKSEKSKYAVWDLEDKFAGRELTFKLQWNIQPWIGPLVFGETVGNCTFTLPVEQKEKASSNTNNDEATAEKPQKKNRKARKARKAKATNKDSTENKN